MSEDEKKITETPGGNKVWCEGGIVHYLMLKSVDDEEASRLRDLGVAFIDDDIASLVLIDLKQTTQFSSGARKIWVKFLQNPKIKKAAIWGGNVFVRTLASFVIAASQKKNIKFFIEEEESIKWLRE